MDIALFYVATAFLSLAMFGSLAHLAWMKRALGQASRILLTVGFVALTASIVLRYLRTGVTPATSRFEAEIALSWFLAALCLVMQVRRPMPVLGAFVTPLAIALLLAASFGDKGTALPDRLARLLPSPWLPLHVWFALLGDALLGISACFAGMYLIQERQIKMKRIGAFYDRLPSLDTLDRLSYRLVSIGFPCLTLGILTGAFWLKRSQGAYIDWQDERQSATLLAWFLYAAILHGRLIVGWRGRRVAWMNVIGFLVILVTFLTLSHFMK